MTELLSVLAKALVNNPDDVSITESLRDNVTVYELHVNEADMGKIIGKQGRIARSIRTVMKSAANKDNKRIIVEIV